MRIYRVFDLRAGEGAIGKLRGGPVFDYIGATPMALEVVQQDADGGMAVPVSAKAMPAFIFADLTLLVDQPTTRDYFLRMRDQGAPLLVDVHFPLGSPENTTSFQRGLSADDPRRDEAADEAARDHWRKPETIATALEVLDHADIVTTPHLSWQVGMSSAGVHPNIRLLHDVTDPASGAQFLADLMRYEREAALLRGYGQRWYQRLLFKLLVGTAMRQTREAMLAQLEQADIDWTYAQTDKGASR